MVRHIVSLTFLFVLLIGCGGDNKMIDYRKLHKDALVADMHSDTVLRMLNGFDIAKRDSTGHMDLPRIKDGGINLQVFACWLSTQTPIEECRPRVDLMIDSLEAQVSRNSDQMAICLTADDAIKIISSGRLATFIGIENGVAIANDISNLEHFYNRGVRYMTLTHTASSDWCISSADTAEAFYGLTDFGREVVRKMNELGMIIDISHASVSAVDEVLKLTTAPVIASHSCVYELADHNRNLTDEQIKAVADNGGVIGINFYNGYLSSQWSDLSDSLFGTYRGLIDSIRTEYPDDRKKRREELGPMFDDIEKKLSKLAGVNVATVVNHIDHIVNLVGADYVGLGSDFDGVFALPDGLKDCSMMPNVTQELVRRGYSEDDIIKILGGNFMRVFNKACN